jgi:hypothetical protein
MFVGVIAELLKHLKLFLCFVLKFPIFFSYGKFELVVLVVVIVIAIISSCSYCSCVYMIVESGNLPF